MLRVTVIYIDHKGLPGREFHPEKQHLGQSGTVVMVTISSFETTNDVVCSLRGFADLKATPINPEGYLAIYHTVMDDGTKLELADYEVDILHVPSVKDKAP